MDNLFKKLNDTSALSNSQSRELKEIQLNLETFQREEILKGISPNKDLPIKNISLYSPSISKDKFTAKINNLVERRKLATQKDLKTIKVSLSKTAASSNAKKALNEKYTSSIHLPASQTKENPKEEHSLSSVTLDMEELLREHGDELPFTLNSSDPSYNLFCTFLSDKDKLPALLFWKAVERYKKISPHQQDLRRSEASEINSSFLANNFIKDIIGDKYLQVINSKITKPNLSSSTFEEGAKNVYSYLNNQWTEFLHSKYAKQFHGAIIGFVKNVVLTSTEVNNHNVNIAANNVTDINNNITDNYKNSSKYTTTTAPPVSGNIINTTTNDSINNNSNNILSLKDEDALLYYVNNYGAFFGVQICRKGTKEKRSQKLLQIKLNEGDVNIIDPFDASEKYISFPLLSCRALRSSLHENCTEINIKGDKALEIYAQSPWESEQLYMILNGVKDMNLLSSSPSRPILKIPSIMCGKVFFNTVNGWCRVFISLEEGRLVVFSGGNVYEIENLYHSSKCPVIDDSPSEARIKTQKNFAPIPDQVNSLFAYKSRNFIPLLVLSLHKMEIQKSDIKGFELSLKDSKPVISASENEENKIRIMENSPSKLNYLFRTGCSSACDKWISSINNIIMLCRDGKGLRSNSLSTDSSSSSFIDAKISPGISALDLKVAQQTSSKVITVFEPPILDSPTSLNNLNIGVSPMASPQILQRPSYSKLSSLPGYRNNNDSSSLNEMKFGVISNNNIYVKNVSRKQSVVPTSMANKTASWSKGLRSDSNVPIVLNNKNNKKKINSLSSVPKIILNQGLPSSSSPPANTQNQVEEERKRLFIEKNTKVEEDLIIKIEQIKSYIKGNEFEEAKASLASLEKISNTNSNSSELLKLKNVIQSFDLINNALSHLSEKLIVHSNLPELKNYVDIMLKNLDLFPSKVAFLLSSAGIIYSLDHEESKALKYATVAIHLQKENPLLDDLTVSYMNNILNKEKLPINFIPDEKITEKKDAIEKDDNSIEGKIIPEEKEEMVKKKEEINKSLIKNGRKKGRNTIVNGMNQMFDEII